MAASPPSREGSDKPLWHMDWEVCGKVSAKARRREEIEDDYQSPMRRSSNCSRKVCNRTASTNVGLSFILAETSNKMRDWRHPASLMPTATTREIINSGCLYLVLAPLILLSKLVLHQHFPLSRTRTSGPRGMVPEIHGRKGTIIGFGGLVLKYSLWNCQRGGRGASRDAGGLSVRLLLGNIEGGHKEGGREDAWNVWGAKDYLR